MTYDLDGKANLLIICHIFDLTNWSSTFSNSTSANVSMSFHPFRYSHPATDEVIAAGECAVFVFSEIFHFS